MEFLLGSLEESFHGRPEAKLSGVGLVPERPDRPAEITERTSDRMDVPPGFPDGIGVVRLPGIAAYLAAEDL